MILRQRSRYGRVQLLIPGESLRRNIEEQNHIARWIIKQANTARRAVCTAVLTHSKLKGEAWANKIFSRISTASVQIYCSDVCML